MTTDLAFIMPWVRVTTTKWNCPELFNLISLVFLIKPLTPVSDKDRISPYNLNDTITSRQVTRIKKNID